jgi:hypothetical protein
MKLEGEKLAGGTVGFGSFPTTVGDKTRQNPGLSPILVFFQRFEGCDLIKNIFHFFSILCLES